MPKAFQTLKDLENPEQIRSNGPFICSGENAWLHTGYYFWDEDINLGHWWGRVKCRNKYVVCKTSYIKSDKCWDIYGEFKHREELISIYRGIKKRNVNSGEEITLREIINELIVKGIMKYEAIRVTGTNSISSKDKIYEAVLLEERTKKLKSGAEKISHLLELRPAIQICFFHKKALDRDGFHIVYPEKYIKDEDYVF